MASARGAGALPRPILQILAALLVWAISTPAEGGSDSLDLSIDDLRARETTHVLRERARHMIASLELALEAAEVDGGKGQEKDIEERLEMVRFTKGWLEEAWRPGSSEGEVFSVNSQAWRILHGIEDPISVTGLPSINALFGRVVLGSILGHPLPAQPRGSEKRPLGRARAADEAVYLYDPARASFHTAAELARMTPEEVSRLDVSPAHPGWYDRDTLARLQPDPVSHFEAALERGITAALRHDGDIGPGQSYSLRIARQVLFLEDIYRSATSPKGSVEDAFGVEWKLKWGDESAVEPVSGRLYLMAGGKMTDLCYTNGSGPADMILILRDREDAQAESETGDKRYPVTLEEMAGALKDFYGFNLHSYVHSHGTVTEENVDSLLRNLPAGGRKKYRRDRLIGRNWVAFRESSVEMKADEFIHRHDGSGMSDLVAVRDRAARGNFLFSMWIGNRDAKDDNNKAYFTREPVGGEMRITGYREGQHDLGLSLGSLMSSGEVNSLRIGPVFASQGLFGRIRFRQAVLFRPKAWENATWADGKWMARIIANITESRIRQAVGASGWPDFVQEALVFKLIERRNRIGEVFDLAEEFDLRSMAAPTMIVPLGNADQITAAEKKYRLRPGSLRTALASVSTGENYVETVVREGRIASCRESALIRVLTRERFPSGLDSRYRRMGDLAPACLRHEERAAEAPGASHNRERLFNRRGPF